MNDSVARKSGLELQIQKTGFLNDSESNWKYDTA